MNNDTTLISLALKPSPSGQRARKVIYDPELQLFIKNAHPGNKWDDYFNPKIEGSDNCGSSGKKTKAQVTERDLAFQTLKEWGEEEWFLAKLPLIMMTPDMEDKVAVAMTSARLKEAGYVDYKQQVLLIEQMDVGTTENIKAKMEAIESLSTHAWMSQLEAFNVKMEGHFDF